MKKILILFILGITAQNAMTQNILLPENQKNKLSNWNFGGNIGLSAENQGWNIVIAPRVGNQLTENFEIAFNANYTFRQYHSTTHHIFGIGPEMNYFFNGLVGHISYFYNTFSAKNNFGEKSVKSENSLFVGGGYRYHLGGNTYAQAGIRYNVLYKKEDSIFASALMPYFGISVGL